MTDNDNNEIASTLTRVLDYIRWGASRFVAAELAFGHGSDNAIDEAAHLVLDTLRLGPEMPDAYLDATLTPAERAAVIAIIERRIESRQPAAYITRKAWFAGLEFFVDERVIVPRSPIAELIETEFQPWLGHREPLSILDLCAGSGAIAIACALAFPEARVVATDASTDALDVARINSDKHDIGPQVEYVEADLFDGLPAERFDLIVSNPPYVTRDEWAGLAPEYLHEPGFAFHGDTNDLSLVTRLLFDACDYLSDDGLLILEVGYSAFLLEQTHPDLPITWVELERGGLGVGVLEAEDLRAWVDAQRETTS
ncbi:50S ribosomal protein L3 N(5)-glutamine methyltransferase [Salinisphaera sp.]|uniref:50S ribosomal protein L3 N(5)-glutamine methyltransferase n=1 Tax=Salinisphaera sp. TaxID=1914330 RepID=UPI000C3DB6CB|nr:50S ribosomal protein L3 N(5)-glutamine methyltransferase [Salinisphaera sp.]MAS09148.1 50S ribosomal protein L3 N(5)-glutamine methyltransferase [Salinisphaera sp.]|tara:strand:- start:370 stop:1305 length:936 start_codon:yes stop_codon:yes gene_type:complete